jgi:hypothetical protein
VVDVADETKGQPSQPTLAAAMAALDRPSTAPGGQRHARTPQPGRTGAPPLTAGRRPGLHATKGGELPAGGAESRLQAHPRLQGRSTRRPAESNGFKEIEGAWYCPAILEVLINATIDLRAGRIDPATYAKRIEARRLYRALPKEAPDAEGHQRFMCPAERCARCPLKERSMRSSKRVPVTISPSCATEENPPACCRQQSVTIPPEDGAKLAQELHYGSPKHRATPMRGCATPTRA